MIPCHPLHLRQYANPVSVGDAMYVVEHDTAENCPAWIDDTCRCEVEECEPHFRSLSFSSIDTVTVEEWGDYVSLDGCGA